jgi:hypothetical protein
LNRKGQDKAFFPFRDTTEWSDSPVTVDLNAHPTQNQIHDLNRKLEPIQTIISSLRPMNKTFLADYIPNFDYEDDSQINDDDEQISNPSADTYETNNEKSLSEKLYEAIDRQTTSSTTTTTTVREDLEEKGENHSQLVTYNITLYLFVFILRIIY